MSTSTPAASQRSLRTTRRHTGDVRYDTGLALQDICGHLAVARDGEVTAWYVAGPQRWSFLSDTDRNALIVAHAQRLAELTGRRLHLRVTHRPYPVALWAQALHESAISPLPGWERYLKEEQLAVGGAGLDTKVVYWGVRAGRLNGLGRASRYFGSSQRDLRALGRDVQEIDRIMSGYGMSAAPATPAEMDWLLTRSVGLGLPAPVDAPHRPDDQWHYQDLAEYTQPVEWVAEHPYAPHTRITRYRGSEETERYTTVLTLGQMHLPPIPESGSAPWLQRLDRLPFSYEISARFDIRDSGEVNKELRKQLQQIYHQISHHKEHNVPLPHRLQRQGGQALVTEEDIQSTEATGLGTRTAGWIRVAVSAADPDRLLDRVASVKKLCGTNILVHHSFDQYALAREFIPAEPLANDAYKRRMPVTTLAGALPAATALVGDRSGPYLGHTSGASRRPVMWHPWRSQEVLEGSGVTPVVGTLGSGKSHLLGGLVYSTARMGVPWVVLDPSGPLTRLTELPEVRPYAKSINLMSAEPGTLNPYRVIPDPLREHYQPGDREFRGQPNPEAAAEEAYRNAVQTAAATRRTLAVDVLRGLLPQTLRSEKTDSALLLAAQRADTSVRSSPYAIVDALAGIEGTLAETAQHLTEMFKGVAEMPQGRLIFPAVDGGDDRYLTEHHRLVVMSLKGLQLPSPGTTAAEWTLEEQYSMPLLYLAAWYAQRSVYDRPMHERKGLGLDESWALLQVPSGRTLMRKTGRDSRKHNVRCLASSQGSQELLDAQLGDWIDSAFIGRTVGADAQQAALRLIGIEPGNGYEEQLESLSARVHGSNATQIPREFVFADGEGGIERITVDWSHRPQLQAALNTTANPHQVAQQTNPWTAKTVLSKVAGEGAVR